MLRKSSDEPPRVDPLGPQKGRFGNPRNGRPEKIFSKNGTGWALDDSLLVAPDFVMLEDRFGDFMLGQKHFGNSFLHGAIDRRGQTVIPFEWHQLERASYESTAILARMGKKWAILDQKGQFLQPLEESTSLTFEKSYLIAQPGRLRFFDEAGKMTFDGPFDWFFREVPMPQKTQMAVLKGTRSGIIDRNGRELFPFHFSRILWANEAAVCIADSTKMEGLADWQGREIVPPGFLHIHFPDKNGLCSARNAAGKMGLLAPDGRVVIPFEFDACWTDVWKPTLYKVEKNGQKGFFDGAGKAVQPME